MNHGRVKTKALCFIVIFCARVCVPNFAVIVEP